MCVAANSCAANESISVHVTVHGSVFHAVCTVIVLHNKAARNSTSWDLGAV